MVKKKRKTIKKKKPVVDPALDRELTHDEIRLVMKKSEMLVMGVFICAAAILFLLLGSPYALYMGILGGVASAYGNILMVREARKYSTRISEWSRIYDSPIYEGKEGSFFKRDIEFLTPRRLYACYSLCAALAFLYGAHKFVKEENASASLLLCSFFFLDAAAAEFFYSWFKKEFGEFKGRFFGMVMLIGSLSVSFIFPGVWQQTVCMLAWMCCCLFYFNAQQRSWVIPIFSLVKLAVLGLNTETSALLLVSAFFILLEYGIIRGFGHFVKEMTEGSVVVVWGLALPTVLIHCFPPLVDWYTHGWEWGLHHLHAPKPHVDANVMFAVWGLLSYSAIARNSLRSALDSLTQILLRWGFKPVTVTGIIIFCAALMGAVAGEAVGAVLVFSFIIPLLVHPDKEEYVYRVVFWCAISLGLSAGIVPVAAPPVAVIWALLLSIGWNVTHLFIKTGLICLSGKAVCAWRIAKLIKPVEVDPSFFMSRKRPFGMTWTNFNLCIGFLVLIIVHVFLAKQLGEFVGVLYGVDTVIGLYLIFARKSKSEYEADPTSRWKYPKRFAAASLVLLVASFEILGYDGSRATIDAMSAGESYLSAAAVQFWFVAMFMTVLKIVIVGTFVFFMSASSDNAMVTSALAPVAVLKLKAYGPITELNRAFVQALPVNDQWIVLDAEIFLGTLILMSLFASVASIPANILPNAHAKEELDLNNRDWMWKAKWFTVACYFIGLLSCFLLWGCLYLYYVHPF